MTRRGPSGTAGAAGLARGLTRAGYAACASALVFSAINLYADPATSGRGSGEVVQWLAGWVLAGGWR